MRRSRVPSQAPQGRLQLHSLPSPAEGSTRYVRVYLPVDYDLEPTRKFPLLLLHDGQNVFDATAGELPSWGVDSTLDQLRVDPTIGPWIAIAVDHRGVDRIGDYSPWFDPRLRTEAPRAARYAEFLTETLLPWAIREFRIDPSIAGTAVAGSSLGGLVSLYLSWSNPELFPRVAALSPSVMWSSGELVRFWSQRIPAHRRIYLDVGSNERFDTPEFSLDYGTSVRTFAEHLRALGYQRDTLKTVIDPQGTHDEPTWRRRLPGALRWILAL